MNIEDNIEEPSKPHEIKLKSFWQRTIIKGTLRKLKYAIAEIKAKKQRGETKDLLNQMVTTLLRITDDYIIKDDEGNEITREYLLDPFTKNEEEALERAIRKTEKIIADMERMV